MSWGENSEPWSWYFKETNKRFPHSYQVSRPRFDQILLDHSAECGVTVHQGKAITSVHDDRVELADGHRISADFVVDASGQNSLIAQSRNLKEWDDFFRNLAVYGYFKNTTHLDPPDQGNIFIEAYTNGWLWKIPLAGSISSVGAVVDRDVGITHIRNDGLESFFDAQLAAAPRVKGMLRNAELVSNLNAVRDWSYCAKTMVGKRFVLVGDAACFVDPLFSTGVHLAITGAHLAAAYVSTALLTPKLKRLAAIAYERLYRTQYQHFHELAKLFYASNRTSDSYFWESRRLTGAERHSPRDAFVRAVSGQSAAGYERSVLSHGLLPEEFIRSLETSIVTREERRITPQPDTRVRFAPGLNLERAAVLGDGCFELGYVIVGSNRDDLPVSPLVAKLVHHSKGDSLAEIGRHIAQDNEAELRSVQQAVMSAAALLIADGVLNIEAGNSLSDT